MAGRRIAIGDIHGCSAALKTLIEAIEPDADDEIVPLGDYIDRGPDARGVVEQIIALAERCKVTPLLGNHESMLLGALDSVAELQFWQSCGGTTTLQSYGGALEDIPAEHLSFFRRCRWHYETDSHIFLHANYLGEKPLDQQPEQMLFWEHISYSMPTPHYSGKTVILGHTPQPSGEILDLGFLKCIDTYCFGGRWLTALDVNSGRQWQANLRGELRGESAG